MHFGGKKKKNMLQTNFESTAKNKQRCPPHKETAVFVSA